MEPVMMRSMRAFLRFLLFLIVVAAIGAAGAWVWAGRQDGPTVELKQPERFVGQNSTLELTVNAPGGAFTRVDVAVEQDGKSFPVYSLEQPGDAKITRDTADRLYVMRGVGKKTIPDLKSGPARIVVTAGRKVLYGLRDGRRRRPATAVRRSK